MSFVNGPGAFDGYVRCRTEAGGPRVYGAFMTAALPLHDLPPSDGDEVLRDRAHWTTSIEAEAMQGGLSYHADVFENGTLVCRIALSGRFEGQAAAEMELRRRLNHWIAEYERRCNKPALS